MSTDVKVILHDCLRAVHTGSKTLSNGIIEWYNIPSSNYDIIHTKWYDGTTHIEYRNRVETSDMKVIYSDLHEKNIAVIRSSYDLLRGSKQD